MAEAVWRETEGNPFFVTEVVRLFDSGEWSAPSGDRLLEIRIPESIRDVVGQRLDRLLPECNELLSVAAVAGREFDLSTLETVTGQPAVELLSLLDEASQSQIIESGEAFGQYRFSHRLIQETLYDELSTSRRFQLHSQIGASLEERHAADLRDQYGILAYHYSQAPLGSNIDKAIDYATKAADRAMGQVAWEEAGSSYELALQMMELSPDTTAEQRCDLLLALGTAQDLAGAGRGATPGSARSPDAIATYWAAVNAARSSGSATQLARAAFGLTHWIFASPPSDQRMVTVLEEALASLPETDSLERVLIQSHLAAAYRAFKMHANVQFESASEAEIERMSAEAVAMADRLGDPFAMGISRITRMTIIPHPSRLSEERTLREEVFRLDRTEEFERYHGRFVAISSRFEQAMTGGDIAAANRAVEASRVFNEETRSPLSVLGTKWPSACIALAEGRFTTAKKLIEESDAIWPNTGAVCNQSFALFRELDRLQDVRPRLDAILHRVPESPWFGLCWILYQLETGSVDESEALFDQIDIHDIGDVSTGLLWPHVMALCTELCIAFEDRERARGCYDLLHPYADQIICRAYVYVCMGSFSHYLGLLAGFLGEWQAADAHFEQALGQHQEMGFHPLVAHTRHSWASMLLKRGEAGDWERAGELLDQASETADRLGMIRLQRLISEAREQSGAEDDESFPFGLSQREVEVLRLVAEGMTDGEIAEELYLSPRTISTYLSSIYNKLGVNSRAAAAAITVRSGLA